MHRFPAQNAQQMQQHPQSQQPYPPQDSHSSAQPYPPYAAQHDARRSHSPYVHPQSILPPAQAPSATDAAAAKSNAASESPPTTARPTRKRKLQSPAPDPQQHQLPPPHPPMPGQQSQYDAYYASPHQPVDSQGNPVPPQPPADGSAGTSPSASGPTAAGGRQLSTSKRAEQNRKAQRAFRERRDAHVKALESRSQLLDAALASADEANRRWEECRALVDQLRVENAALRAALGAAAAHAQGAPPPAAAPPPDATHKQMQGQENGTHHQASRSGSVEHDADE